MFKTLCQPRHLDVENLFATVVHLLVLRHERQGVDGALQVERLVDEGFLGRMQQGGVSVLGVNVGAIGATLGTKLKDVYLGDDNLRLEIEAFALRQQLPVFVNQGIATVNHVLCAFAEAASAVHIACHCTRTLLCEQTFKVGVFADKLVAGREVTNDVGPSKRQIGARRIGRPHVFAYFDTEFHTIGGNKDLTLRCE